MTKQPVKFHDQPDRPISLPKGKYTLADNRGYMLGDATTLLERASVLIADYANMTGFGDTHQDLVRWLADCQEFKAQRDLVIFEGRDYRDGK